MKAIYEPYPEEVCVNETLYPIVTDFREWIKFHDMIRDPEISKRELVLSSFQFYLEDVPKDGEEAFYALLAFYARKEIAEVKKLSSPGKQQNALKKSPKPLFDYRFDADCIAAGFYFAYRIDIDTVRWMHWHKFLALLDYLPSDTEFRQRIYYRGLDAGQIKNKQERERVRKIKQQIALPSPAPTANEIGDLFW